MPFDNLNAYYGVTLKEARLARAQKHKNFFFHKIDLADRAAIQSLFRVHRFDKVIHLGAQAGVRHSL